MNNVRAEVNSMFDAVEQPIQEWIAKIIDPTKKQEEVFGLAVLRARNTFITSAVDNAHCALGLIVIKSNDIASDERKENIQYMKTLPPLQLGRMISAYEQVFKLVYNANIGAKDFTCNIGQYEKLKELSFVFNTGAMTFVPVQKDNTVYPCDFVIALKAMKLDQSFVNGHLGIAAHLNVTNPPHFIENPDELLGDDPCYDEVPDLE